MELLIYFFVGLIKIKICLLVNFSKTNDLFRLKLTVVIAQENALFYLATCQLTAVTKALRQQYNIISSKCLLQPVL